MNSEIRSRRPCVVSFEVSFALVATLSLVCLPAFADRKRVQITVASVKAKPYGYVATVERLPLGTEVEVQVQEPAVNGYVRIEYKGGQKGYVLESSLATPERYKGIEEASAQQARATGEATATYAAAKGWDKPTEEKYSKAKNLDAEFKQVDEIEKGPYPDKSADEVEKIVLHFAAEGKLGEAAITP